LADRYRPFEGKYWLHHQSKTRNLFFYPGRWSKHVPAKDCCVFTILHCVKSQKTISSNLQFWVPEIFRYREISNCRVHKSPPLVLFFARRLQSTYSHSLPLGSTLMVSFHPCVCLQFRLFTSGFLTKILYGFFSSLCCMPRLSRPLNFIVLAIAVEE
jgi:hypothetical protein